MIPKPKWQYVGLRSKGEIYIYIGFEARFGGSILGPFYMKLFLGKL